MNPCNSKSQRSITGSENRRECRGQNSLCEWNRVLTGALISVLSLSAFACARKSDSAPHSSSPKFEQYFVHGQQLYLEHCSNCHQKSGVGLGLVYPPLNKSDYMEQNFEAVICLIRNGTKGDLTVNGGNFNKAMPGIPTLTDLDIAEIATYIYNSWDHERGLVEVQDAERVLKNCEDAKTSTP